MIATTPLLFTLISGFLLVTIGMVTLDPFRFATASLFAGHPGPSAFWLLLISCMLLAIGACSLLDATAAV